MVRTTYPAMWGVMAADEKMQFYLSVGLNDQEIAKRLRVHRITIGRWKRDIRRQFDDFERKVT